MDEESLKSVGSEEPEDDVRVREPGRCVNMCVAVVNQVR